MRKVDSPADSVTVPSAPSFTSVSDALERQTTYVYTPPSHRLLYRVHLRDMNDEHGTRINLLEKPLALALENKSDDISVDIHPSAALTRLYLENQLCSLPITSADGTTDHGVRITLGDLNSKESSEILIYGQLPPPATKFRPTPSTSSSTPQSASEHPCLRLLAARILPAPPTPVRRLPRPDDPSPRFPPLISFGRKRRIPTQTDGCDNIDPAGIVSKKQRVGDDKARAKGKGKAEDDPMISRAREVMLHMPKSSFRGAIPPNGGIKDDDVFKVPSLPRSNAAPTGEVRGQGKGKAKEIDIVKELEKANKALVKKAAVDCLSLYGIQKAHPEFKELWGFIYRGTEFALRSQMRSCAVDIRVANKVIKAHTRLYVDGLTRSSVIGEADSEHLSSGPSKGSNRTNGEG
ncbi:hypothetical protein EW146_g5364 [Bondarzewia mesenterica]|uniref:Sld7 C-terminal domain-containing protein n=1 Tax=Bondarzewia mesenterica TaxID=1095465 RepID=A0A4V6S1F4_9AGAM|nr:hypothetical protein EW146_g5364 [Bondarzewia mesenterica]